MTEQELREKLIWVQEVLKDLTYVDGDQVYNSYRDGIDLGLQHPGLRDFLEEEL